MKKALRSSLSSLFYHSARLFGQNQTGGRILCYHRVNDDGKDYITVSVSNFQEQMRWLAQENYRTVSLNDFLDGRAGKKTLVITFDDGYMDNFQHAFPAMKECGFAGTIFCIGNRVGTRGYLGKPQISEMRRHGFEFGSHTLTHPHLKVLSREEKIREISGSKEYLKQSLEMEIDFFCYPYGEFDREAHAVVREAGYRAACSNRPGANLKLDPYRLKRTEIGFGDTLADFQKKMAGAYDFLYQSLHWLRGRP